MLSTRQDKVSGIKAHDPFGMLLVGRNWEGGSEYRFGFNGKESDKETYGDGNIYDYGFRIYNPRLGKFLSVDPLNKFYPMLTPYQFTSNRPIDGVDLDGLEYLSNEDARFKYINGLTVIDLENNGDIVKSKIESAQNSNFDNRSLTQIDNVGTFGLATFEINPADFEGTWLDMPHIAEGGSLSLSPQTGIKYYFQSYDNNYNNTNVGKSPARLNLADENYELRFVKMNRLNRASNAVALVQGVDWLLKFRSNYIFKKNMRQLDAQYYKYAKLINSDIREAAYFGLINPTLVNDPTFMSNVANWLLRGTLSNPSTGAANLSMSELDYTNLVTSTAKLIFYGISMSTITSPEANLPGSNLSDSNQVPYKISIDGTGLHFNED